jgi:hypothetical protein
MSIKKRKQKSKGLYMPKSPNPSTIGPKKTPGGRERIQKL